MTAGAHPGYAGGAGPCGAGEGVRVPVYGICGLVVASEIELPGPACAASADAPQVVIRRGPTPESLPEPSASGPTWQMAGRQFLLCIPGIARFLITDGRELVVTPDSDASLADVPVFILNTAFGILLHQRGEVVLHASAVAVDGKAVLFCGSSGAGKSTLAAALAQRGYPVICDDLCALTLQGAGAPLAQSDGGQLQLWAQAIGRLGLAEQRGERVRPVLEKYRVAPSAVVTRPLPLGAVYAVREARPPYAAGIERPNAVDAAVLLRRNAYRPLLIAEMGQRVSYFRAATAAADGAGVFHLIRPLDFARLPEVIADLEAHWLQLRLEAAA
jgi:hypothetical protein